MARKKVTGPLARRRALDGLSGIATGVRDTAKLSRLFVDMMLMLVFGEFFGLYTRIGCLAGDYFAG